MWAPPFVVAVSRDELHRFSKAPCEEIELVAGLGVRGDAHAGTLVQHRSRVRREPNQPNLRQVHLIQAALLDEAGAAGHDLGPGSLGENVLTGDLDLLALPEGTQLRMGEAVVRVTGLRNPCRQIEEHSPGLLRLVVRRGDGVGIARRAGVMGVVEVSGTVRAGDTIGGDLPPGPHTPLAPV
ncbi:MOSC domain-containing protein [Janibacter terrae]|uniref:MOSC domain-containing protein n=1 Tax=Janibacter terrae TaxID=103817 RepID=UPI00381C112C